MICSATAKEKSADKKIQQLKQERQKLIANTASFKKYSNAYRDTLKSGQRPLEDYLRSMEEVVMILDKEVDRTKNKNHIIDFECTSQTL